MTMTAMTAQANTPPRSEVLVVYEQQEHELLLDAPRDAPIDVPLLQGLIFSLVGVTPENQVLVTCRGEIIAAPWPSLALPELPWAHPTLPERIFVLDATRTTRSVAERPTDWREICTRCVFGDLPVVQRAFRAIGGEDSAALLCGACAQTCGTDAQPVSPLEWKNSAALRNRFISDIAVITGGPDIIPPPDWTRVPGVDLNYSASGDFIHLLVKRGGSKPITQLRVHCGNDTDKPAGGILMLPLNCNHGNGSKIAVHLGYAGLECADGDWLNAYAVTDICVVTGKNCAVPEGFIKIPRNLNAGACGSEVEELFLCYKLAPLGGFTCARSHGAFGACLFESRNVSISDSVIAWGYSNALDEVLSSLSEDRERTDNAFMEAHFDRHKPVMRGRLEGGLQKVRGYEDPRVQAEALKRIPVEELHARAQANPKPLPSYQDELVMQLTHWFKREFFTWMNQPKCSSCGHEKTRLVRTDPPRSSEEIAGQASRVEVYQCPVCGGETRFPRFNDPVKLLDTRTGRCGEWANCFTLCCRAMGFEARYVLDVTDHVWTEVYSEHEKRWLHCDSCEDQLDCPLTYEGGWGKKLSYIFSFSHEEIVDTAKRYTQNWEDMRQRRTDVHESWLQATIISMNKTLSDLQTPERRQILAQRAQVEQVELDRKKFVTPSEVSGRVSGSDEWKSQRSEDGKSRPRGTLLDPPTPFRPTNSVSTAEVAQSLCKQLLVGCDRGPSCQNMYCFHTRSRKLNGQAPTELAAEALQRLASLQQLDLASETLEMFLCSTRDCIRNYIQSLNPWAYFPLQDAPLSNKVMDISGNDRHAETTCPVRKPFKMSTPSGEEAVYGLQLFPYRKLSFACQPSSGAIIISWICRIDKQTGQPYTEGGNEIAFLRGGEAIAMALSWFPEKAKVELRGRNGVTAGFISLRTGDYHHFVFARSVEGDVTVLVDGVKVTQLKISDQSPIENCLYELQGGNPTASALPVISHLAVVPVPLKDEIFVASVCETIKSKYICRQPLQAFNDSGSCSPPNTTPPQAAKSSSLFRVHSVRLWGKEFFDGVQFIYQKQGPCENDLVDGPLIGNERARDSVASPDAILILLPDEFISKCSGRKGAWADCFRIETNIGRRVECGGKGGGEFAIKTPRSNVQIRFVTFDVGEHLTNATAFVDDEPDVESCLTVLELHQSLDGADKKRRLEMMNAARRYLENIAKAPLDLKYQRIRASNKFFASSIGQDDIATKFMTWCGFTVDQTEDEEVHFVFIAMTTADNTTAQALHRLHYLQSVLNSSHE